MDSISKSDQTGWRNYAKDYLINLGIRSLDPCKRPHSKDCSLSDKEIVQLDLNDVLSANFLLVDSRHKNISMYGTPIEVFYANHILGKPTIGWYDEEHGYNDNSIFQNVLLSNVFPSLDEALDHIGCYYA
jgi:hypothetical protein